MGYLIIKELLMISKTKFALFLTLLAFFLNSCSYFGNKKDEKSNQVTEKKKRISPNVRERLGESQGIILRNNKKNESLDFASSNPLWQASLKVLDFMPLDNASYSGGVIVTDWYTGENGDTTEQMKITVKFVSKEVKPSSFEVTTFKKICKSSNSCKVTPGSKTISSKLKDKIIQVARDINIKNLKK